MTGRLNKVISSDLIKGINNFPNLSLGEKIAKFPVRMIWKGKESGQIFQTILQQTKRSCEGLSSQWRVSTKTAIIFWDKFLNYNKKMISI